MELTDKHTLRIFNTNEYISPMGLENGKIVRGISFSGADASTRVQRIEIKPLVICRLPEHLNFSMSSTYEKFANGQVVGGLKNLLNMMGISLTFKWMDLPLYVSSDVITFKIPIKLVAETDAFEEVIKPVYGLLRTALPRESTMGVLVPPGVNILEKIVSGIDYVLDNNVLGSAKKTTEYPPVKDVAGNERLQYESDFVEAARRTIDQINIFKWGEFFRSKLFPV